MSVLTGPRKSAFNAYVSEQPQETLPQRSALASWINQTLRHMGLLLMDSNGRPAILLAGAPGRARRPRFILQSIDETGKRAWGATYDRIPELQLRQAPARIEHMAKEYRHATRNDQFQR